MEKNLLDNLIPINQAVKLARAAGVSFGFARPKTRFAYLTKLRLLPQTIRRKINGRVQGCYPADIISMLKKIEEMRGAGLTYSQIRRQITGCPAVVPNPIIHFPSSYPLSHYHYPLSGQLSSLAFLTVGLLLGYLLFMVNYQPKLAAPETAPTAAAMSAAPDTVALPGETWRQQTIRAISLTDNAETDEAVYLLTVPGRHLYKLGKTDVNFIK